MQAITPTPEIKYVFGSMIRLYMQCHRRFYYAYMRNLQRKGYYLPFVMGKIFHQGAEDWYNGMSPSSVMKNTANRINKFLFTNVIDDERRAKVRSEIAAVQGMLRAYMKLYSGEREKYDVLHAEQTFSMPLDFVPWDFVGTVDLLLLDDTGLYECDHKTARYFDQGTVDNIAMDSQVYAYPRLIERCLGMSVKGIIYNIIRKPSIRHRQGETFDDYIARIHEEYLSKPDAYFWRIKLPFQRKHEERVWRDLTLVIVDLYNMYSSLQSHGSEAILEESNWARDTRRCHDYARCEFWPMCRYGTNKYTEPFLFTAREHLERGNIIYAQEGPKEDDRAKVD